MPSDAATFGLPSTSLVGRTMPKKAFYEHLEVPARVKSQFTHDIERIELVAALKESSIHISAGSEVAEIDVLGIRLKGEGVAVPTDAIDLIARAVPNKLVFVCLGARGCKFLIRRDRLYETAWAPLGESRLQLRGSTLDEAWGSLSAQVVFGDADPAGFEGRLQRANELASLQECLGKLQKKRLAEKQIARRNSLWDQIKAVEKRITELEAL